MLSPDLKMDMEIIVAACTRGCIDVSDIPSVLAADPEFWKEVLTKSCIFWWNLLDKFKSNISFAHCIKCFSHEGMALIKAILEQCLALSSDMAFWSDAILNEDSQILGEELQDLINTLGLGLCNDRQVMLQACMCSSELLDDLPSEFQLDREFIMAAIEVSFYTLADIPFDVQLLYPDLVTTAISNLALEMKDDVNNYIYHVNPKLWVNLEVANAWLEAGGIIHDGIPMCMKEDQEFCLLVAEHCCLSTIKIYISKTHEEQKLYDASNWKKW